MERKRKNSACLEKDREDHEAGTSSRKNMKREKIMAYSRIITLSVVYIKRRTNKIIWGKLF